MALGGAFTAVVNDASAVYWNAAGLGFLEGSTNFILGTAMIAPKSSFRGVSPSVDAYYMENQVFYPSHFFITQKFSDVISAGVGLSTPFGLGTKWDEDWVGKYLAVETELRTFSAPLVLTFTFGEKFAISVGGSYS